MRNKKILIADGHHRYETSLMYRDESSTSSLNTGSSAGHCPEDFTLTLFMESSQEDIKIYPTYRTIKFKDFTDFEIFLQDSSTCFNTAIIDIKSADDITSFLDDLRNRSAKGFIFYAGENRFYGLTAGTGGKELANCGFSGKELDVSILHNIMISCLESLYGKSKVTFSHDFDHVIECVKNGDADLGIFLNAPTISEMEEICNSGKLMPQKSTFFWPKPATGFVMYKFDQ